jgi:carbamoyltransferase
MQYTLGISAGFHDAAAAVVSSDGDILFASHSERYSKKKHDECLSARLIDAALAYGPINTVAYYENHWLKKLRQLVAGQRVSRSLSLKGEITPHFSEHNFLLDKKLVSFGHHKSHAAAGFQTSPFTEATVVVIDAIGELDTISIWKARYNSKGDAEYELKWKRGYPHSIGLFYSAMTARVGLRPMDEEYILMGMAAWGKDTHATKMSTQLVSNYTPLVLRENMHVGVSPTYWQSVSDNDIAACTQTVAEHMIYSVIDLARTLTMSNNLVYMGGVALNCSANRDLGKYFNNIWIMPNPGDAGSSLGAAALVCRKKLNWTNAFLGELIEGEYPVQDIIHELLNSKIVGVASGRAEFGPRALGNRSLLADPRGAEIKDKVNQIKHRQRFRPFAPVILEELVDQYFDMPLNWHDSRYMQVVAKCKYPELYPAIVHIDGTSRVQTVPNDNSGIRRLLEAWYAKTGCPMLLNTSLNIRGEPMVNDLADAARFSRLYGVKVCS